jgi:hypothetical protein
MALGLGEGGSQVGVAPDFWSSICFAAQRLSVLIIALAHVWDIASCESLPLSGSLELLTAHNLVRQLHSWNGRQPLRVSHDAWFQAITLLLVGHKAQVDWMHTCLLSDKGWSVFLNTFGESDPSHIDAGFVTIMRGVPCRNGVYKRCIIDGPTKGSENSKWRLQEVAGDTASLRCRTPAMNQRAIRAARSARVPDMYRKGATSIAPRIQACESCPSFSPWPSSASSPTPSSFTSAPKTRTSHPPMATASAHGPPG